MPGFRVHHQLQELKDDVTYTYIYIYTHTHRGMLLSHIITQFAESWMDLKTVIQNEVSLKEKNKYYIWTAF